MNNEHPTKRIKVDMEEQPSPSSVFQSRRPAETVEQFFEDPEQYYPLTRFLEEFVEVVKLKS